MQSEWRKQIGEYVAAIGCGLAAAGVIVACWLPHGRADEPVYQERVIAPIPDAGQIPSAAYDPSADCGCTGGAGETNYDLWLPRTSTEQSPYYLSLVGGASYADDSATGTGVGGLLGLQAAVPIVERTGMLANVWVNSYSGGTQYSGGLGLYRNPTYYGSGTDRFGGSIIVDQFTDTGLGSPYLVLGRYSADYAVLPGVRAGIRYVDPIHGRNGTSPGAGGWILTEAVEATLNIGSVRQHINLAAGYAEQFNSPTYQLNLAHPISSRVSGAFDVFHIEQTGYWWGYVGLQIDLSPRRRPAIALNSRRHDVVRGAASVYSAFSLWELSAEGSEYYDSGDPFSTGGGHDVDLPGYRYLRGTVGGGKGGGGGCENCPPGFVPSGNGCVELANLSNFIPCPP